MACSTFINRSCYEFEMTLGCGLVYAGRHYKAWHAIWPLLELSSLRPFEVNRPPLSLTMTNNIGIPNLVNTFSTKTAPFVVGCAVGRKPWGWMGKRDVICFVFFKKGI